MIRTGQIDGLMAFKWQGRLISVPVCMQTMQRQKVGCVFAHETTCFLCLCVCRSGSVYVTTFDNI